MLLTMVKGDELPTDSPRVARWLAVLLLVLAAGPLAIAWGIGYYPTAGIAGCAALYILYPHLSKFVKLLFTGKALVLGEEGLFDRTFPLGFVPWSEIKGASLEESKNHKMVILQLRDEEAFKEKFVRRTWLYRPIRRRNLETDQVGFWIDTHWIDESPGHILEAIRSRIKTTT